MDDRLDRVAGRAELGGQAIGFLEAEHSLLAHDAGEPGAEVLHRDAQRRNRVLSRRGEGGLDAVEALQRQLLPPGKVADLLLRGTGDELRGGDAHHQEPGFEIAARVGQFGISMHALEGAADLVVPAHEGDADGEQSAHRNEAKDNDAGANR